MIERDERPDPEEIFSPSLRLGLPQPEEWFQSRMDHFIGWVLYKFLVDSTVELSVSQEKVSEFALVCLKEAMEKDKSVMMSLFPHESMSDQRLMMAFLNYLFVEGVNFQEAHVIASRKVLTGEVGFATKIIHKIRKWMAGQDKQKFKLKLIPVGQSNDPTQNKDEVTRLNQQAVQTIQEILCQPRNLLLSWVEATRVSKKWFKGPARPHPHAFSHVLTLLDQGIDTMIFPVWFEHPDKKPIGGDYAPRVKSKTIMSLPLKASVAKRLFEIIKPKFTKEVLKYHLRRNPTKMKNLNYELTKEQGVESTASRYSEVPDEFNFSDFILWLSTSAVLDDLLERGIFHPDNIWIDDIDKKINEVSQLNSLGEFEEKVVISVLEAQVDHQHKIEERRQEIARMQAELDRKVKRVLFWAAVGTAAGVGVAATAWLARKWWDKNV